MPRLDHHIFVCVNERIPGHPKGSCAHAGGREVADALRGACHAAGLRRVVRVNEVQCIDQCSQGAALVVYPAGTWYGSVTPADVPELMEEHLRGGRPVERLRIPEEELTGRGLSAAEVWTEDLSGDRPEES